MLKSVSSITTGEHFFIEAIDSLVRSIITYRYVYLKALNGSKEFPMTASQVVLRNKASAGQFVPFYRLFTGFWFGIFHTFCICSVFPYILDRGT